MKKIIRLLCRLLTTILLLSACSKDDTPTTPNYRDLLTQKNVSATPETLQIVEKVIPVSFTVNVPARFLPRKALLTLNPVLVCGDKTYGGTAKTWQGEGVEGGNEIILYDQPSQLRHYEEFAYEKTMSTYLLYLEVTVIDNTGPTSFRIRISEGQFEPQ